MAIPVRHTWCIWLAIVAIVVIVAAAGFCASAAAQTGDVAGDRDSLAAVDVAPAALLEPANDAAGNELATPPELTAEDHAAPFIPAQIVSTQDAHEEIDEPPITGDVDILGPLRGTLGSPPAIEDHSIVVDAAGEYIHDDWVYEDDSSFAWLISSGTWLHRGRWFGQAEATLVHRSTAQRQILSDVPLIFQGQTFFSDAMTTETAGFGYEPGLRVTVGKYLGRDAENRDRTLEFTFWGLTDWTSQHGIQAVNPNSATELIRTPLDRGIGAYNFATSHEYAYDSDLNSFEMNARISRRLGRDRLVLRPDGHWERQCDPGRTPTFLAGFRIITIDEDFLFAGERSGLTAANLPDATGRYEIGAQNRLFGVQLGAELINQHCSWSWGVRGKVGGYANFVEQQSRVRVEDTLTGLSSSNRDEAASDVQMTLGAELGLVGTYQIRPNVALRASYDFIYLQGLALGPEQLDFNAAGTPKVRSGSHIFYDGGSIGLEIVW